MIQAFCWIIIIIVLSYLILYFYFILFIYFLFLFLEERDIKVEQNYIFNLVFNGGGLRKSN